MATTAPAGPSFDAEGFKAATRTQWDRMASGWNEHGPQIGAWLRDATDAMLEQAGVVPGARVLDVAAGAGEQTLDIARRVGPAGSVLATDLSPAILALAGDNARRSGHANVLTQVADGERLDVPPATFDAVVCRLGLMFFPDPLRGLREMHAALRPGGRCAVLVFSQPEHNPCIAIVMSTAMKHAAIAPGDPYRPGGLLSLGKPGLLDSLFTAAGFRDVVAGPLDAPFRMPSVTHYLEFLRSSAGPVLQVLGRLDDEARERAWQEISQRLDVFSTPTGWQGPNELLLVSGQR